jgi:hypothetical protein
MLDQGPLYCLVLPGGAWQVGDPSSIPGDVIDYIESSKRLSLSQTYSIGF